ncbi:MAG TPA: alpha/beta hydrolase-fold protein, partial [Hanamia sp.]|nr:alpha/beta hydrolase-fold protein [Hanamia sp.]
MRKLSTLLIAVFFSAIAVGQNISGTVVMRFINSSYLKNSGGENPNRRISVYLPPGYEQSKQHYPVIYYLHGFMGTDTITPYMKSILDRGIVTKKIRPYLMVIADNYTLFSGSFYSNSPLIGDWTDFEAKELVSYMDKNFRTIPTRDARGLGGHSMGGYGVLKIGMLYPDV